MIRAWLIGAVIGAGFLWVAVGALWVVDLASTRLDSDMDWLKAVIYTLALAAMGAIVGGQMYLRDKLDHL